MNDADRHDQIEALTDLKGLLDDEDAADDEIRDAAIRAVNRFDASIAAHSGWQTYSRRGSSDAGTRAETAELGKAGVECHPEYRGRLRRRIGNSIAEIAVTSSRQKETDARDLENHHDSPVAHHHSSDWRVELRHDGPWIHVSTTSGSLVDAEMIGARRLAEL